MIVSASFVFFLWYFCLLNMIVCSVITSIKTYDGVKASISKYKLLSHNTAPPKKHIDHTSTVHTQNDNFLAIFYSVLKLSTTDND